MINNIHLSQHQEMLCEAIASTDPKLKSDAALRLWLDLGDELAFKLVKINQVDSIFAHILLDAVGSEKVSNYWLKTHKVTHDLISAYLLELDRIANKFFNNEIPLVALKNAGIARGIFPCPGCCPMGDLDVMVERSQFRKAHQILLHEGYHFKFRSPLEKAELSAAEEGGSAEYWKILPNGEKLWFELQWRPVAGRWIRPDQEPSAKELIARSMTIPDTKVRLLAPEDNLLQVALHTAKHSYIRAPGFRLHTDVDRIVALQKIDWDVFLGRVIALQVKTAVYFSLVIPFSLFNTHIPEEVLKRLRPSVWKEKLISRWLHKAGFFNPDERKFSHIGYIVFTALLYDDLSGLWRGIFPQKDWMKEHYNFHNNFFLPYYHVRRLKDLALRRVST